MGDIYYYVSKYNDEVPPHEPTLESAASFLHTGRSGPDDPDFELQSAAPLAAPGEIIALDTLDILFDAEARRVHLDDGEEVWEFTPAIPAGADFGAMRWGEGTGWDADSIFDPGATAAEIRELMQSLGIDDDTVAHIAIGRTGQARAVFDLVDDKPVLTLLEDGEAG